MTQPLLIEHDDGVDRVTLNRPESLNALDPGLIDALNVYFEGLQRNRSTRVVVLKGAGASFCAGLDLKHAMQRRAGQQEPPGVTESLDSQRRIQPTRDAHAALPAADHRPAAGHGRRRRLCASRWAATCASPPNGTKMNCAFIKIGLSRLRDGHQLSPAAAGRRLGCGRAAPHRPLHRRRACARASAWCPRWCRRTSLMPRRSPSRRRC